MTAAESSDTESWRFCHFGLFVTGKGESLFLPDLFRSLSATGQCTFKVLGRIGQRSAITSPRRIQRMTGRGMKITDPDQDKIGIPARIFLQGGPNRFVMLIDDIEGARAAQIEEHYGRYRTVFDTMLGPHKHRASVHFMANMMEAYYFAHTAVVNEVLGVNLSDHEGDVETIGHPKNELKKLHQGFDEIEHGARIIKKLDALHILSNPETCKSLRTAFAWCAEALGLERTADYQLVQGQLHPVTSPQIELLSAGLSSS